MIQHAAPVSTVADIQSKPPAPKARAKRLSAAVSRSLAAFGAQIASAVLWFLLMTACGAGLLTAGVFVLAGPGWALIAAGVLCFCVASFIRKGMTGG